LKNTLKCTKLVNFSKVKRLVFLCLLICFQNFSFAASAARLLGNPKMKADDLVSKIYDQNYTISRDNTLDFYYSFKDGSSKNYKDIQVFPNGTIIVPKVGEEFIFDKTTDELKQIIFQKNPNLTDVEIFIKRVANNFSVLGEVNSPGSYSLADVRTIYDGIAKAKGFTEVAKKSKVLLIRQREDGSRYTYEIDFPKEVFNAYGEDTGIGEDAYLLREGDLIYVGGAAVRKMWRMFKKAMGAATIGVFAGIMSAAIN